MLPNFLLVGAEKCGTTSLATLLRAHPQIFMSTPKELNFFAATHEQLKNHDTNWGKGIAWYERFFENAEGYKAIGEASPSYTWSPHRPEAPKRIFETLEKIKYLYIVRNPIDRMISHYRHGIYWDWYPQSTSFERALELIPGIKDCSRYFFQIDQYLKYSSQDQWHVVSLEQLTANPDVVTQDIFAFLEVAPHSQTCFPAENQSKQRKIMPDWPKSNGHCSERENNNSDALITDEEIDQFKIPLPEVAISKNTRNELVNELLPDIHRLGELFDTDFESHWNLS